jgi:hypothetical protein
MQIERHQIELRYQSLRVVDPAREARLAASLLAHGQRQPVLVFAEEPGRFVLVDGHRRLRALTALRVDVLSAMDLECVEADALLRAWQLGMSRRPEAIEEAWLVRELKIFPNASCTVALIDRLIHHADIVTIEGDSYRRREAEAHKATRRKKPDAK